MNFFSLTHNTAKSFRNMIGNLPVRSALHIRERRLRSRIFELSRDSFGKSIQVELIELLTWPATS